MINSIVNYIRTQQTKHELVVFFKNLTSQDQHNLIRKFLNYSKNIFGTTQAQQVQLTLYQHQTKPRYKTFCLTLYKNKTYELGYKFIANKYAISIEKLMEDPKTTIELTLQHDQNIKQTIEHKLINFDHKTTNFYKHLPNNLLSFVIDKIYEFLWNRKTKHIALSIHEKDLGTKNSILISYDGTITTNNKNYIVGLSLEDFMTSYEQTT